MAPRSPPIVKDRFGIRLCKIFVKREPWRRFSTAMPNFLMPLPQNLWVKAEDSDAAKRQAALESCPQQTDSRMSLKPSQKRAVVDNFPFLASLRLHEGLMNRRSPANSIR